MESSYVLSSRVFSGIMSTLCLLFVILFSFSACAKEENASLPKVADYDSDAVSAERKNLKLGVVSGPYGDMFMEAIFPFLKKKGYKVELVYYNDFIRPNLAMAEKEVDLNMFQHSRYLNDFKFDRDLDLMPIVEIPTASMGIFSKRYQSINSLGRGITVSIPDDNTNLSRALRVLNAANVITLDPSIDMARAAVKDIISNPYRIQFTLVAAQNLVRSLDTVDASVINGNFAISGGLNLASALYNEVLNEGYVNIIAVRTEDLGQQFVRDIIDIAYLPEYVNMMMDTRGKYAGFQRPRYFYDIAKKGR